METIAPIIMVIMLIGFVLVVRAGLSGEKDDATDGDD